ncbi:MAG: hypothetical protein ACI87E_004958 [Mariniblastus sp.]
MTNLESFLVNSYSVDGDFVSTSEVSTGELDAACVSVFQKKFQHLSGDLELPFEDKLPSDQGSTSHDVGSIKYRIGSDLNGAYVLYYLNDAVIFSSLILSGTDAVTENELLEVFKFLLLDTEDSDEPTEEEIEEILGAEAFDFHSVEQRPVVFEVEMADQDIETETVKQISSMNRHLALAFLAIERPTSD